MRGHLGLPFLTVLSKAMFGLHWCRRELLEQEEYLLFLKERCLLIVLGQEVWNKIAGCLLKLAPHIRLVPFALLFRWVFLLLGTDLMWVVHWLGGSLRDLAQCSFVDTFRHLLEHGHLFVDAMWKHICATISNLASFADIAWVEFC